MQTNIDKGVTSANERYGCKQAGNTTIAILHLFSAVQEILSGNTVTLTVKGWIRENAE
jgi:hypothetical protein